MFIYLKLVSDALRVIKNLILYENFLKINRYNLFKIWDIFIIRTLFSLPSIKYHKSIDYSKNLLNYDLFNREISSNEILEKLDNLGHVKIGQLDEKLLNKIIDDVNRIVNIKLLTNDKNQQENIVKSKLNGRLSIKFDPNYENIKKFVFSEINLNLAKQYLRSKKITIKANILFSVNSDVNDENLSKNAQLFHNDNDFKKFFKIFIYLNDVDNFNGPHVYVEKSHKKKNIKNLLLRRFSDPEIKNIYKNKIKYFLGKKGSIFYVDTFGIHKGEPPIKGSRKVLVIEYGSDHLKYDFNDFETVLN